MNGLLFKLSIFVVAVVLLIGGMTSCGKPAAEKTATSYSLTHTAADTEYILSWDTIVSRCPDIGAYDKHENFIRRGETKPSGSGSESSMEADSPAAWASMRTVMTDITGESFRGFGVFIYYFELDEYLDELMQTQMSGFPVQEDGEFVTGIVESKSSPMKSVQFLIAGKHFVILIMESASSDESFFLSKEELMELLPVIKSNISSVEITTLSPDIPERKPAGVAQDWQEFMTFRSEELSPPIRVPEGQHYNDLIFSERPLVQVFSFTMDKDWRFVMTAEGMPDTRFEVYITVTSQGLSYSTDHVFTLHSAPLNIIREEPLEERYAPPVDIEIKVYFDKPMDWTMKIEK